MRREYNESLTGATIVHRGAVDVELERPGALDEKRPLLAKNVSNAERLSTPGSASTWPKSGLIVASSFRFGPRGI